MSKIKGISDEKRLFSFGKIRYDGNYYPISTISVYDYNRNTDKVVKVSNCTFFDRLKKDMYSSDKTLEKRASDKCSEVNYFIPDTVFSNGADAIRRYVEAHLL